MPGGLGAFAILVAAAVIALAMVFVWLLSRDQSKTSFGFFVSREHFDDPLPFEPGETPTEPHEWPERKPD